MSDYTPTVEEVRTDYVLAYADRDSSQLLAGAAFDHFIAKVRDEAKADALRDAAIGVTTQVNNAEAAEADKARDPGPYYHGARYGMRKTAQWLHRRADRIEGEA